MRRRGFLMGASVLVALAPLHVRAADELTARDMMLKNFFVGKIKSLKSSGTMTLINDKGEKRERKSTTYAVLQPNGIDSKLLVKFSFPDDINGTAFLQIEHIDSDDDEWIYLPALGKSRRLVANNKKDSFVGSDFSYGDISLPKVDFYDHRLLGSESISGQDCYKIQSTPKTEETKDNSGYSKKITWLRKDNFVETKVEYYDLSGHLLKIQLVGDAKLVEPDNGRWFALRREMANQQTGHKTTLIFGDVSLATNLPEDLFTTHYLERE